MHLTARRSPAQLTLLQPVPVNDFPGHTDEPQPGGRDPRARRRWIAAGGAAAVSIPAGPGLIWGIEGKPGAAVLLTVAAVVAIGTAILSAVTAMYEAQQETRRKEIECRSTETLAAAVARCLDDAHARPSNSSAKEARETARVRASAHRLLANLVPSIATVLQEQEAQDAPGTGHQAGKQGTLSGQDLPSRFQPKRSVNSPNHSVRGGRSEGPGGEVAPSAGPGAPSLGASCTRPAGSRTDGNT